MSEIIENNIRIYEFPEGEDEEGTKQQKKLKVFIIIHLRVVPCPQHTCIIIVL